MRLVIKKIGKGDHGEGSVYFKIVYLHPMYIGKSELVYGLNEACDSINMSPGFTPLYGQGNWHIATAEGYWDHPMYQAHGYEAWANLKKRLLKFNQRHTNNTLTVSDVVLGED